MVLSAPFLGCGLTPFTGPFILPVSFALVQGPIALAKG
jgi:hypothetical protein